jgi:hypothetical protein
MKEIIKKAPNSKQFLLFPLKCAHIKLKSDKMVRKLLLPCMLSILKFRIHLAFCRVVTGTGVVSKFTSGAGAALENFFPT